MLPVWDSFSPFTQLFHHSVIFFLLTAFLRWFSFGSPDFLSTLALFYPFYYIRCSESSILPLLHLPSEELGCRAGKTLYFDDCPFKAVFTARPAIQLGAITSITMQSTPSGPFLPRQSSDSTGGSTGGDSTGDVFLHLIANPFSSQVSSYPSWIQNELDLVQHLTLVTSSPVRPLLPPCSPHSS